jgi:hypothetical protein
MCVQVTKTANRFEISSCIAVALAIEGWQTTSGLTIPSLYDWCSVFVKQGMLLTVHVQVDLAKWRRERTGSYPDGRGNGRSVQLSDQWTRLHVQIVHPKWSCDQSNRAWRWRNVNCGRFMGRRARIPWWWMRVLMWPPSAKLPWSAPGPLVWWKSFFVTPYRRSCKGLVPTKHFISRQPHFEQNSFWWIALVNFSANTVLYMLYRVHVWRHRRACNCLNNLLL